MAVSFFFVFSGPFSSGSDDVPPLASHNLGHTSLPEPPCPSHRGGFIAHWLLLCPLDGILFTLSLAGFSSVFQHTAL